jgi:hypothetical protein
MTTFPDDFLSISQIKDRASLQLVGRLIEAQRLVLEAQLTQIRQVQEAVGERMKTLRE